MNPTSAPVPPDLRPLSVGELVDRSAALWRQNFGAFFKFYIVIQLASFVVAKAYELFLMKYAPLIRGGARLVEALQNRVGDVMQQYAIALGGMIVLAFLTLILGSIGGVVGSHYAIRRQLGQPSTVADGVRRAREKLGTILGTVVLSTLMAFLAMFLFSLPGILLMGAGIATAAAVSGSGGAAGGVVLIAVGSLLLVLGVIVAMLWYVVRFMLTAPVIANEEVTALGAIKRSGALVSGRVGPGFMNLVKVRATVLLTLAFVIVMIVGLVAGLPAIIVQFTFTNPLDAANADPDAVPQALLIPAQLLTVLAQAAFTPILMVVSALFYVDMRVRREGLDLELKLAAPRS